MPTRRFIATAALASVIEFTASFTMPAVAGERNEPLPTPTFAPTFSETPGIDMDDTAPILMEIEVWSTKMDREPLGPPAPHVTAPGATAIRLIPINQKTGLPKRVDLRRIIAGLAQTRTKRTVTALPDLDAHIGSYSEIVTDKCSKKSGKCLVTFDTGATYALTESLQLGAAVNVGLTHATPELNSFIGISWRF